MKNKTFLIYKKLVKWLLRTFSMFAPTGPERAKSTLEEMG